LAQAELFVLLLWLLSDAEFCCSANFVTAQVIVVTADTVEKRLTQLVLPDLMSPSRGSKSAF